MVMSKRGEQWKLFADKVFNHIEEYTVPQYGDKPNDSVAEWDSKDCFASIHKYVKRFGTNSREGQQYLDMLKIAHYACIVHDKMKKEEISNDRKTETFVCKKSDIQSMIGISDQLVKITIENV